MLTWSKLNTLPPPHHLPNSPIIRSNAPSNGNLSQYTKTNQRNNWSSPHTHTHYTRLQHQPLDHLSRGLPHAGIRAETTGTKPLHAWGREVRKSMKLQETDRWTTATERVKARNSKKRGSVAEATQDGKRTDIASPQL